MSHDVPADFPKDRLALCMIVKNEAATLARCLASAAPWVSEMVVVDTGSTDDTVAIATSFGAKVLHFDWVDDFSAARNAALDGATRPWVLVLDADEQLVVKDAAVFADAVRQTELAGFSVMVNNVHDAGRITRAPIFRLFDRTRPQMRYRGHLHEQLIAVFARNQPTGLLKAVEIEHDGYMAARVVERDKVDRNYALAKRQVQAQPKDPHAWYALGISTPNDRIKERLVTFEKALGFVKKLPAQGAHEGYVTVLYINYSSDLMGEGRTSQALAVTKQGLKLFPGAPDLLFVSGEARFASGDFEGALADFRACLEPAADEHFMQMRDPQTRRLAAHQGAAKALRALKRYDEEEEAWRAAIADAPPDFSAFHRHLGGLQLLRGDAEGGLETLRAGLAIEPESEDNQLAVGYALARLDRLDEAVALLAPFGERPEVAPILGRVRLEQGDAASALPLLGGDRVDAHIYGGIAQLCLDNQAGALAAWRRAFDASDLGDPDREALSAFRFLVAGDRKPAAIPAWSAAGLRSLERWTRLLVRNERFDEIEACFKRGPQLGDHLWPALKTRIAGVLAGEGFAKAALPILLGQLEATPNDPETLYWVGFCALEQRELADARVLWEACLKVAPDHRLASEGLALLPR